MYVNIETFNISNILFIGENLIINDQDDNFVIFDFLLFVGRILWDGQSLL